MEVSLGGPSGLTRWPMRLTQPSAPLLFQRGVVGGGGEGQWGPKVPNLQSHLGLSVTSPHPEAIWGPPSPGISLACRRCSRDSKGLSSLMSGTWGLRPNIITTNAPVTQEMTRVSGALCQELEKESRCTLIMSQPSTLNTGRGQRLGATLLGRQREATQVQKRQVWRVRTVHTWGPPGACLSGGTSRTFLSFGVFACRGEGVGLEGLS